MAMNTVNRLPTPVVLVIDRSLQKAEATCNELRSVLAAPTQALTGELIFVAATVDAAKKLLSSPQQNEIILVVTDRVGFFPLESGIVAELRDRFRHTKVLFYSAADDSEVRRLKKRKLFDGHVRRTSTTGSLTAGARSLIRQYLTNMPLNEARKELASLDSPDEAVWEMDGAPVSPIAMFCEMARGTDIGETMLETFDTAGTRRPR